MQDLTIYIIRSAVSIILFYGIYEAFLRKDTFFSMNRFYLVGAMLLSLIIPFFPGTFLLSPGSPAMTVLLDTITITPGQVENTFQENLTLFQAIFIIYITGVVLFSARFLVQIFQLSLLIRKYGVTREFGSKLVILDKPFAPFSFFELIFINPKLLNKDHLEKIIEHELVHVKQKHSVDLILLEIMTILQWFNPVIWFYRSSLKGVHEYLADEGVLKKGTDRSYYQKMLLQHIAGIQVNDLTNNFNHSLLKRRFIMMTKNRSQSLARIKYAFAFPVTLALAFMLTVVVGEYAVAQEKSSVPPPPPKEQKAKSIQSKKGKEEQIFKTVDVMPEFKGGQKALINYLVSNINYPEEAKKNGTQGKVVVSFVVMKNGKVERPMIVKGVDPLLDAEALRVVGEMPNWTPGKDKNGKYVNVEFALPIQFNLEEKAEKKK